MSQTGSPVERLLTAEVRLRYDLDLPPEAPAPLLIALHGYGSNKGWMMREARRMAPPSFAVAALQGFHQHLKEPREAGAPLRYGFGWLTNYHPEESIETHHRALRNIIAALTTEGVAQRERVFLLGFSQPVGLNYRFAFTHVESVRGVVALCGGLPGDWETSARYRPLDGAVLHLYGERDEFYPSERVREYEARLRCRAADVDVRGFDAGHEITPEMREAVGHWLQSRMREGG